MNDKKKNKPAEQVFVETKQYEFPEEKVIRVVLKDQDVQEIVALDPDAIAMSKRFPSEPIITVYNNGIPTVMSVKQLLSDVMLQIKAEQEIG